MYENPIAQSVQFHGISLADSVDRKDTNMGETHHRLTAENLTVRMNIRFVEGESDDTGGGKAQNR